MPEIRREVDMPKVKWGGNTGLSASVIDNAKSNEFSAYDGPTPPRGVYGFTIKSMKLAKTSNENPQIVIGLELTDRGRAEHKKFKGFYLTDFIVVKDTTAWRIKPLLKALGVSSNDFMERMVRDDDNNVTMIGDVKPVGQVLAIALKPSTGQRKDEYPMEVGNYLPKAGSGEAERPGDTDAGDTDTDDDAPF